MRGTALTPNPIPSYPILSLSSLDFLHLLFAFMRCHAVPTCMLLCYIYCMRAARLEISYHALIGTTTSRHCIFSPYLVASCFQYKSGAQSAGRGTCSRLKGALGRPQPEQRRHCAQIFIFLPIVLIVVPISIRCLERILVLVLALRPTARARAR